MVPHLRHKKIFHNDVMLTTGCLLCCQHRVVKSFTSFYCSWAVLHYVTHDWCATFPCSFFTLCRPLASSAIFEEFGPHNAIEGCDHYLFLRGRSLCRPFIPAETLHSEWKMLNAWPRSSELWSTFFVLLLVYTVPGKDFSTKLLNGLSSWIFPGWSVKKKTRAIDVCENRSCYLGNSLISPVWRNQSDWPGQMFGLFGYLFGWRTERFPSRVETVVAVTIHPTQYYCFYLGIVCQKSS